MTREGFKGYCKQIHEDISMAVCIEKSQHEMGLHKWAEYKWKQEILIEYKAVILLFLK